MCTIHYQWKWSQQINLFRGQFHFPFPVARQGLGRHLCKCSAFVCSWSGFTWLLVTLLHPLVHVSDSTLSIIHHLFPHSHCIPPVTRADRHSPSAGTLARVDQVSHLPGDCAACAYLWFSAAQLEVFSVILVCCQFRLTWGRTLPPQTA